MKTDEKIQQDVMAQLKWNPLLTASEIGVSVRNGVVTLSGQVDTYFKKVEAEKEAKKVGGVKAIAQDIHVGLSPVYKRTDTEIAEAIVNALKWDTSLPEEALKAKVEDGIVTLEGEVEWAFQRELAKKALIGLAGVVTVVTNITIKPQATPDDVKKKISAALHRHASMEADKIQVHVNGSTVILEGTVGSFAEKEEAEEAAWAATGIMEVENKLEIVSETTYA